MLPGVLYRGAGPLWRPRRASYRSEVISDAPLVSSRYGEASGIVAADASGNGRNGTYSPNAAGAWTGGTLGQAGLIAGDPDTAALFNGSSGYVSYGDPAWVDFGAGDFTLELWAKPTSLPAGNRYLLIGKDASGQRQFGLDTNHAAGAGTAGDLELFVYGSGGAALWAAFTAAGVLTAGNPYHIVAGRSGGSLFIRVNGVDQSLTTTGSPLTMDATSSELRVGARSFSGFEEFFPGVIDEVEVYGTALSAARALAHYRAGISNGNG